MNKNTEKEQFRQESASFIPQVPKDSETPDVFAQAKDAYRIGDLWSLFDFPGQPSNSCKSPFREENRPSFSVYEDGKKWKDHASGDGGDIIEFIKFAIDGSYEDVRDWLTERLEINVLDARRAVAVKPQKKSDGQAMRKSIQFPESLVEGTKETWEGFARNRRFSYGSVWTMVQADILRFLKVNGEKCFVVMDAEGRAAEIRKISGRCFGESKAFPLIGVDKTWLPGAAMLRNAPPQTSVLVCEGATDLLSAIALYFRYRKHFGGARSWVPVAVLGAGCKVLSPECADLIAGRHVRLIPDGDDAGMKMREHWATVFTSLDCGVDAVEMPDGMDLGDLATEMDPTELSTQLFS